MNSIRAFALLSASLTAQAVAARPARPSANGAIAVQDSNASGEIVVTAQRRSERLVDVPVSVTAIGGQQLSKAAVNGLFDVTNKVPGVIINRNGGYLQPTIRGIGTNVTGPGADPNVAIYLDGIYQSSQTGNMFDLANVESVEVLKGPQGTLFGRNATGGAILVKTRDPQFTPTGQFTFGYGSYREVRANGYVTGGITDTLAAEGSVYYRHSDGYIKDLLTGEDRGEQRSADIRGKLLWKPTDSLRFVLGAAHTETSDPTGLAFNALGGNSAGRGVDPNTPIATKRGTLSHDLAPEISVKQNSVDLHADLDTGIGTIHSISAYKKENDIIHSDLDASYVSVQYAIYKQFSKDFTQEINLTSKPGGRLSYVVGAFYFDESAGFPYYIVNGIHMLHADLKTQAYSFYADGTYTLGKFSIIAGIRYSHEQKHQLWGAGDVGPYTTDASKVFSNVSPRAGLRYALSSHSNVYATYSKGFKSGTYNVSSASTVPVKPEGVDAYEVGFKTSSRGFSLNTSAFYYDYKNIQVTAFDFTKGISTLLNAAKARIYGGDIDATYQVTPELNVRGAFAYTHARYTSFPGAVIFLPKTDPVTGAVLNTGNLPEPPYDASGNTMIRAPKLTASANIDYRIPVGGGDIDISASPYWTSKINYSFDERIQQPAYFTMDANISWSPDEHLRVSLWGKNLTNKVYASFRSVSSTRDSIVYAPPRTVGGTLGYSF
jgi:iron complex outermembrane receptor protein